MPRSKPIPVKLSDELISRLDEVSQQTGLNNRSAIIKFCLSTFLDHFESKGRSALPPDWKVILRHLDGRTHRYKTNGDQKKKGSEARNRELI